jgi:acetaldehyde dehydrogenase / alcohol dehydrogenase
MSDQKQVADELLLNASMAAAEFGELGQEATDKIVKAVYKAGLKNRVSLAKLAHEETGIGVWEHKVLKNLLAAHLVYEDIKELKTAGIISHNELTGIVEIAQPLGPIIAIIPVTNPTSTIIFKTLIALKTRNPIIFSPHRNAMKCSDEAARICYEAALSAGAPENCVQWSTDFSRDLTHELMTHPKTALLLATGGPGLVKAAYSSGTPAYGVGSGNVPVLIEKSADVAFAAENVLISKTFDNGTVCASEQAIVVESEISDLAKKSFEERGAYFLNDEDVKKLEAVVVNPKTGLMNAQIVGKSPAFIAELAGIKIPKDTKVLMAPQEEVSHNSPLSGEILAPVLAYYVCDNFESALKRCVDLNYRGGIGHTASIYSNDSAKINEYGELMNAGRIVVNTPSSQGGVGGIFNTLHPSFTLGCGAGGKNITTENVSAQHLMNIKKLCRRKNNNKWINLDLGCVLDENFTTEELIAQYNKNS